MRVLVTGSKGYIGTVLCQRLLQAGYEVVGLDSGFFQDNLLEPIKENYHFLKKDIRDVDYNDLAGLDAIIHLAGLSNDPLGEFDVSVTEDINLNGTVRLAEIAKRSSVRRFVFASTQSIYGVSKVDFELDEDDSVKDPVTAYAKTKWAAEMYLRRVSDKSFVTTSMRPSTVFGWSPRLRTDIVFNNFVSCAFLTGEIEILSDGSPWRPVIHVEDVCDAFVAATVAPDEVVNRQAYNVGVLNGNYSVRELANAASDVVRGSAVKFCGGHTDPRSYKVCFDKIFRDLGNYYRPNWSLQQGGDQLIRSFSATNFTEESFRGRRTIRLLQLAYLRDQGYLTGDFRITND